MGTFGLSTGSADFLPSIRINGKDGGVERSSWDGNERGLEVIDDLVALFDFATLKVGWIEFTDKGPDKRLVAIGDPLPDRPGEKFKQGIELVVLLPGGLGCHEICTTAIGVVSALEKIYDETLASSEWQDGKVPVVRLTEFVREKTKHGNRAIPVFAIFDWKERPAELEQYKVAPKPRAAMPATTNAGRPAATGSTQMTPPNSDTSRTPMPDFG